MRTNWLKTSNSLFEVFLLNNAFDNNFRKLVWFTSYSVKELCPLAKN
jgi:hypothetical protein